MRNSSRVIYIKMAKDQHIIILKEVFFPQWSLNALKQIAIEKTQETEIIVEKVTLMSWTMMFVYSWKQMVFCLQGLQTLPQNKRC